MCACFPCAYFVINAFYFLFGAVQMENLDEKEENLAVVEELEIHYYETQLELYNVQLEVLKHEEMLLIVQLDALRRQIKGKNEEILKDVSKTQEWWYDISVFVRYIKKKKKRFFLLKFH